MTEHYLYAQPPGTVNEREGNGNRDVEERASRTLNVLKYALTSVEKCLLHSSSDGAPRLAHRRGEQ